MKLLFVIIFLLTGFLGFGQSKKEINKQLTAKYHFIDSEVDSLMLVYGSQKTKENQVLDSFKIIVKDAYEKEKPFNELINEIAKSTSDLKLLGIKQVESVELSDMDSLLLKSSMETVSTIVSKANRNHATTFFGFSKYGMPGLYSYSKKEQNALLQLFIEQRGREKDLLVKHIDESRQFEPAIHDADSALNFLYLYRESIIPYLNGILEMLDKELSKQRMAYMKTGRTGFPLNYHRVFPDVFPETGPEIDFNNQPMETDR